MQKVHLTTVQIAFILTGKICRNQLQSIVASSLYVYFLLYKLMCLGDEIAASGDALTDYKMIITYPTVFSLHYFHSSY